MKDLVTLITNLFPELKFSTETIFISEQVYEHIIKLSYNDNIILFMRQHNNDPETSEYLLDRFNEELLIQILYSKETNEQYINDKGELIYTFADIKNKLITRNNDK